MKIEEVEKIIEGLLEQVEEEEVSASLFTMRYQDPKELQFFCEKDRDRVIDILRGLSEDSREHKVILKELIALLGERIK